MNLQFNQIVNRRYKSIVISKIVLGQYLIYLVKFDSDIPVNDLPHDNLITQKNDIRVFKTCDSAVKVAQSFFESNDISEDFIRFNV